MTFTATWTSEGTYFWQPCATALPLAGYFIGLIFPMLHYKHLTACNQDIFYVLPRYRNGHAGVKLFRAVERELRQRGVHFWHAGSKLRHDSDPLMRRMGFTPVERLYSKRLRWYSPPLIPVCRAFARNGPCPGCRPDRQAFTPAWPRPTTEAWSAL